MTSKTPIEKAIEHADKLSQLVCAGYITKEELRKMLGLKEKPSISQKKNKSKS